MKTRSSKSKIAATAKVKADKAPVTAIVQPDCPPPDALLAAAKEEPKRVLLMDFIATINTLRDEKKFTFRAIADWFEKRGIETDHSAVYRAYLTAVPLRARNPDEDWSDVEEFDAADVNVKLKKP
jgi:hypothetical protein